MPAIPLIENWLAGGGIRFGLSGERKAVILACDHEQDHLEAMTLSIYLIRLHTVRLTTETDTTPPLKQALSPPLAKASAEFFTALSGG